MDKENIRSMIALQSITNQFLEFIDSIKKDKKKLNMSIGEVLNNFYERYEEAEAGYKDNHYFFNQYQLISSLYVYIVLPKEKFFDLIPDKLKISTLKKNSKWGLSNIKIEWGLSEEEDSFKHFLRRMRNAISHGNIKFKENLEFTFTDVNKKNKSDYFEVTFSMNEIVSFIRAIAYWWVTEDIELKKL